MEVTIALVEYSTLQRTGMDAKLMGSLQMPTIQVHAHVTVNMRRVAQVDNSHLGGASNPECACKRLPPGFKPGVEPIFFSIIFTIIF